MQRVARGAAVNTRPHSHEFRWQAALASNGGHVLSLQWGLVVAPLQRAPLRVVVAASAAPSRPSRD